MCLKTCGYFFCWSDQVKMGHAGDVYTHFTTSLGMPVLSATYLHPQLRQIIFEGRKKSLLLGRYECRWPPSWLRSSEKLCRKLCLSAHRAMWYTSGTNPWAPTASESIISEAIHCPKLPRIKRHGFKVMVWKMYLLSDMPLFWGIYVRFQGGVISEVMFVLQRIMHNKISGTPATLVDVCVHGQKKRNNIMESTSPLAQSPNPEPQLFSTHQKTLPSQTKLKVCPSRCSWHKLPTPRHPTSRDDSWWHFCYSHCFATYRRAKDFFAVSAFWLDSIKRKKWLALVLSILSWCQNKNLCSKIQKRRILNVVFGFCLKKNQIEKNIQQSIRWPLAIYQLDSLKTFTWKPLKHLEGIAASVTGRLDQKESTSKSIRHQKWFLKKSWGKKTSYVCQSSKKKTRLET